ncbi:hypothetical protein SDC9_197815 [bioreactor metagenome]|uniref:Uncharacterized protein n=1 Tax=bioreactor metagenome TaxID=1076179 RepID=A0A645II80_9ZZZZ
MQEGVDLTILRREVAIHRIGVFDDGMVLGVMLDQLTGQCFKLGQYLTLAMLAPGFDEEGANLITGRIEHLRLRQLWRDRPVQAVLSRKVHRSLTWHAAHRGLRAVQT